MADPDSTHEGSSVPPGAGTDTAPASAGPREELVRLLRGRRVLALTGAGISTESGIPDYRGPGRAPRNPIQHREFMRSDVVRRRYWARAFFGHERFSRAQPNDGHRALATLERRGPVVGVVTQNVDGLHQQAGSEQVIELHGALRRVRCLDCTLIEPREALQERLRELNPGHESAFAAAPAPDGDADLPAEAEAAFRVAGCLRCGGLLKPDVVFFGDNVERSLVDQAFAWVEASEVLLVLGSSLTVFSGFRFVRRARELGRTVVIVNRGETRGDALADLCVDERLGQLLPTLALALCGGAR